MTEDLKDTHADPVDAAWEHLDAHWEEDGAHDRFLSLCQSLDRLPEVGRRYGKVRDTDEARRPVAEARIQKVITLAMAQMESSKTDSEHTNSLRRAMLAIAIAIAVTLTGLSLYAASLLMTG